MDRALVKKSACIVILIASILSLPRLSLAQPLDAVTSFIRTPPELSAWLSREFRYEMEIPDYWQQAEETLDTRKGDCEDFAIFSQAVLRRLGIRSDIVIIKFKGLNLSHAISIFKNGEFYSFFSNQKLVQTKGRSVTEAIQERYPDWDKIIFTNVQKQTLKVILRNKVVEPQEGLITAYQSK